MNVSKYFKAAKKNFTIRQNDIDPSIKDFITELNKFEDVVTNQSCEGHGNHESPLPYLSFNISPRLWKNFWIAFVPFYLSELHESNCIVEINNCEENEEWNKGSIIFRCLNYYCKGEFWNFLEKEMIKFFIVNKK